MKFRLRKLAVMVAALGALCATSAQAGLPYPTKATPAAIDLGPLSAQSSTKTITVTLALKLRDPQGADALLHSLYTVGNPQFHQFLTPAEFRTRFAATDADVAGLIAQLAKYGLTAQRASATALQVTGTPAALERAFQVSLHAYQVPATESTPSFTFHAPTSGATVPNEVSTLVHGVLGLSTRPSLAPHNIKALKAVSVKGVSKPDGNTPATANPPGSLTVADFEQIYNVGPLTKKGVTGAGSTIGIVTLASFTPSDDFAYWASLGLNVDPNRITIVNIDGGPGAPSDDSGSLETTIDTQQSGGLAPGAKLIVYQAPNTNQAFVDAFAQAVESNLADSVSASWGEWEWFNQFANGGPVTAPDGETTSVTRAFHEIFRQAAIQGQSMFASAGDAGAYDANDGLTPPDFTLALSVDGPGSDPYITAAGGTTLASVQGFLLSNGETLTITIPHERAWSWSWLNPVCAALDLDPISCGIFPVGGGGGVSILFDKPEYQEYLDGTQRTQPGQVFSEIAGGPDYGIVDIPFTLPAYFKGRNLPDISANADPYTGYQVPYTSSVTGYSVETGWGGTSFVAPELNGITALINQYAGQRVGLLNFPLYDLAHQRGGGYYGWHAPFHVIKYGDNDFYHGRDGYSPAVGIGTLDVSNFADAIKYFYRRDY
jgi:subtilase family serine protease